MPACASPGGRRRFSRAWRPPPCVRHESHPMKAEGLVVGAGPAGSAAATHLARAGRDVLLVDAATFPRVKACAEYARPATATELRRCGIPVAAWHAAAVPVEGMR